MPSHNSCRLSTELFFVFFFQPRMGNSMESFHSLNGTLFWYHINFQGEKMIQLQRTESRLIKIIMMKKSHNKSSDFKAWVYKIKWDHQSHKNLGDVKKINENPRIQNPFILLVQQQTLLTAHEWQHNKIYVARKRKILFRM